MAVQLQDVVVAFEINRAQIELVGTVEPDGSGDSVIDIRLTEASKESLAVQPLGTIEDAITALFKMFDLGDEVGGFLQQLGETLEGVPALSDLHGLLFKTEIYLIELVFTSGKEIQVGVQVKATDDSATLGPITFRRAGVHVIYDLSSGGEAG